MVVRVRGRGIGSKQDTLLAIRQRKGCLKKANEEVTPETHPVGSSVALWVLVSIPVKWYPNSTDQMF